MKKLLALVLALVMTLGLATVGSNAAFADAESIDHEEAVEVLSSLGVIAGKENNNFDPDGLVKRSEMAKMIAIILLGADVNDSAFVGASSKLTDINGHWAEGFIKYCVSQKIVGGYGDGTFQPDKDVTTAEAAKMLLTALGYNAEVQEYIGSDWSINVLRDAATKKLLEGLSGMSADKAITRDQAAQMIYNTIQRGMIIKGASQDRDSTGLITDTYTDTDTWGRGYAITLLGETFDAIVLKGTFIGNYATGAAQATNKGWIQFNAYNDNRNNVWDGTNLGIITGNFGFPYDFDIAQIGEEIKVIYKNTTESLRTGPDRYDTIYGVFNTGATQVLNTTVTKISRTAPTNPDQVKIDDVTYESRAAGGTIYTNFDIAGGTFAATPGANATALSNALRALNTQNPNAATLQANDTQKTDKIKVVFDANGKISGAYVTAYAMTHLTSVTSDKVSLAGVATIEKDKNEVYEGAATDDVVVWTAVGDPAGNGYRIVEKAETVEGKVDGYAALNNTAYQKAISVDGTQYSIYNYTLVDIDTDDVTLNLYDADSKIVGKTVRLYMINGAVGAVDLLDDTEYNWGLILSIAGAGNGADPYKVQLLLADNTKKIYTVYDKTNVAVTTDQYDLIKFNVRSDGTININTIVTNDGANTASGKATDGFYNAGMTNVWNADTKVAMGAAVASSDCVLFADTTNTNNWKAYSIRNLKTLTTLGVAAYWDVSDTTGQVVVAAAKTGTTPAGGTNNTKYAIVTAQNGNTTIGSDAYSVFTVYDGENSYPIYIEGANINAIAKGALVTFDRTTDDKYDGVGGGRQVNVLAQNGVTVLDVAVDKYDTNDMILTYYTNVAAQGTTPETYAGTVKNTKAVDKDVKIIYVDQDGDKAGDNIGVTKFDTLTGYPNVKLICDSDGVITAMLIESSRKTDVNGTKIVASTSRTAANLASDTDMFATSVVVVGDVTKSAAMTIDSGETLTITGDLATTGSGSIQVDAGGTLNIYGDSTAATGDLINNGGTINVYAYGAKDGDVSFLTHTAGTTNIAGTLGQLDNAAAGSVKADTITTIGASGTTGIVTTTGTLTVTSTNAITTANVKVSSTGTANLYGDITTVADTSTAGTINYYGTVATLGLGSGFAGTANIRGTAGSLTLNDAADGTANVYGTANIITAVTATYDGAITVQNGGSLVIGDENGTSVAVDISGATITGTTSGSSVIRLVKEASNTDTLKVKTGLLNITTYDASATAIAASGAFTWNGTLFTNA